MRALLISTYDLGRQPLGLASPAAWLRQAGIEVDCADTSRERIDDGRIVAASLVGFYLPMHTATRLAAPLIDRVRRVNPSARLCAYGLYASLNAHWLRERGVTDVLGPEAEHELVELACGRITRPKAQGPSHRSQAQGLESDAATFNSERSWSNATSLVPKARRPIIQPDRTGLIPLERYASLRMPDGRRRTIGSTDATRGCKHLCRHCPIVPVYRGRFRAVPIDVVLADVRVQVQAGARHISFGDPDFFNGPTHARRVVAQVHREFPDVSYDVTIKIEHLLQHADLIPVLRSTGCLFVTSAVESVDDVVLEKLHKGHTRRDFIRAVELCRNAGLLLAPTFIPFTPWTTLEGYVGLLNSIRELDIVEQVAPVQLGIRLLVTADSLLLDLPEIRSRVTHFDPAALVWQWRHDDPRVDSLQSTVMQIVKTLGSGDGIGRTQNAEPGIGTPDRGHCHTRAETFAAIFSVAREQTGLAPVAAPVTVGMPVPQVSEPWYCCAEPMENF